MNRQFRILSGKATIKQEEKEEDVEFSVVCDPDIGVKVSKAQMGAMLMRDLPQTRFGKNMEIEKVISHYSLVEKADIDRSRKLYDHGDVVVHAHIPYCLHLPSGYQLEIEDIPTGSTTRITNEKQWTQKATGSSSVDLFFEDRLSFFNKGTITSAIMPVRPNEGWEQNVTGENLEKKKDTNGMFRYSKLAIEFTSNITDEDLEKRSPEDQQLDKIIAIALEAVNRLLDTYRHITREEWVEPLGGLSVNEIYFPKLNKGFHIMALGQGVGTAMMNRTGREISRIEEILSTNEIIPLYDLLLLNAEAAFSRKAPAIGVLESFQALEIYVENFLFNKYSQFGLSEGEVKEILKKKWKITDRLKSLVPDTSAKRLTDEHVLWSKWRTTYDVVRNGLAHAGRRPSVQECRDAIDVNIEVITWIKSITTSNNDIPLAKKILSGTNTSGFFGKLAKVMRELARFLERL